MDFNGVGDVNYGIIVCCWWCEYIEVVFYVWGVCCDCFYYGCVVCLGSKKRIVI